MQSALNRACAVAALTLSVTAHSAVTVTPSSQSGYTISVNGANVSIVGPGATGSGHSFTISTTSVNDAIGEVIVENTGAANTSIRLNITGAGGAAKSLFKVERDADSTGEVWISDCTVSENIGAWNGTSRSGLISVNRVGTITCDRNLYADINLRGSGIATGLETDLDYLHLRGANRLYYEDGYLAANIIANGSSSPTITSRGIGLIEVFGTIGSIDGGDMDIETTGDIASIIAHSLAKVDIATANSKSIAYLEATGGGWGGDQVHEQGYPITGDPPPPINGVYTQPGTLTCGALQNFTLKTSMQSDITCYLAPSTSATWKIGKTLATGAVLTLPAEGLTHQIIVNQQNSSGAWTQNIIVGSTSLASLYENLPDTLGEGSAGLAPFNVHWDACRPIHQSHWPVGYVPPIWLGEGDPPCTNEFYDVVLHHYGELDLTGVTGAFSVERRVDGTESSFDDVTEDYSIAVVADLGARGRDLYVYRNDSNPWEPGYEYNVTIHSNKVKCFNVAGSPYVPGYTLNFILVDNCVGMFDMNLSGEVEGGDVTAWLAAPADFNTDNAANGVDLGSMLRWIAEHP